MKNLSKADIDRIAERILSDAPQIRSKKELDKRLMQDFTASQRERIWMRYRYLSERVENKCI